MFEIVMCLVLLMCTLTVLIYVFMVKDMSVVVNVMVSLMSVMNCIVQPIGTHGGEVIYFGSFLSLGVSLVSRIVRIFACVS